VRERTHTFVTEKDCKREGESGVRKKERARARERERARDRPRGCVCERERARLIDKVCEGMCNVCT